MHVDVAHLVVRIQILRLNRENLFQMLERFVAQTVLHVDVGLGQQLLHRFEGFAGGALMTGGDGAARGNRGSRRRPHLDFFGLFVIRRELENFAQVLPALRVVTAFGVNLRELAIDADSLVRLAERGERLRQHFERANVARVGLEAHL